MKSFSVDFINFFYAPSTEKSVSLKFIAIAILNRPKAAFHIFLIFDPTESVIQARNCYMTHLLKDYMGFRLCRKMRNNTEMSLHRSAPEKTKFFGWLWEISLNFTIIS
jgi:hypothetical protein